MEAVIRTPREARWLHLKAIAVRFSSLRRQKLGPLSPRRISRFVFCHAKYVHVDFSDSGRRAYNFLYNLQTPGDNPELTVIEEDVLGNFRRGQVKYAPDFGILNGDNGMHATNE